MEGPQIYRTLLLLESTANIASTITMILNPESSLSYLVRGPAQITPATKTLTQWLGGLIVLATAPLLLSYPEPTGPQLTAAHVSARRRLTYMMLGTGEVALALLTASQYVIGDSGMSDRALLTATGIMGVFGGVRAFFLFAKPGWMEPQQSKGGEKKM